MGRFWVFVHYSAVLIRRFGSEVAAQGLMQSRSNVGGQRDRFLPAVNLDGFAGRVHDNAAILASTEMNFELGQGYFFEVAIEIAGKFADDGLTVHAC